MRHVVKGSPLRDERCSFVGEEMRCPGKTPGYGRLIMADSFSITTSCFPVGQNECPGGTGRQKCPALACTVALAVL